MANEGEAMNHRVQKGRRGMNEGDDELSYTDKNSFTRCLGEVLMRTRNLCSVRR